MRRGTPFVFFFVFLLMALMASPANADIIKNGENAVDILGEFTSPSVDTTADYVKGCPNNGASSLGFEGNSGANYNIGGVVDATNHRLFVADTGNNRVLVFTLTSGNLISSKTPANVLGQPDFVTCAANQGGSTSASSMNAPNGMDFDATHNRLFVADYANNRVLVFNTSTITNGMSASNELGQPSGTAFTSGNANQGGLSASSLSNPSDVKYDSVNNRIFVSDDSNNRVLVFNTSTITNGMSASNELGQPSGTAFSTHGANQGGIGASTLSSPMGLAFDSTNTRLFVSDQSNDRVLVFSTASITNGMSAANELGQPSGTAFTTSAQGTTQSTFNWIHGIAYDSTNNRVFVADVNNNRVMVFSTSSITNGENASYELGQADFTSATSNLTTQSGLSQPVGVIYDSTNSMAYVWDNDNNRVMIFNVRLTLPTPSSPTQSGDDACAIASGQLYCWGYNLYGEDGDSTAQAGGSTAENAAPVLVNSATNWTAVTQGDPTFDEAACGIAGGALYCWGRNRYGELGLGNTTQYTTPQQVGVATNWSSVSTSGNDTCAINTSGALYCWGRNEYGELGLGNTTQYTTPQQVLGGPSGLLAWWKFTDGSGTAPVDSSNNSHTGSFSGSPVPTWVTSGPNGGGLSFTGAPSIGMTALDSGNALTSTNNFSVSAWVYFNSVANQQIIIAKDMTTMPFASWALQLSSGSLDFSVDSSTSPYFPTAYYNFAPVTGVWYHLVGVFSGGTSIKLYVNGTAANSTAATFSGTLAAGNSYLTIGWDKQSPTTTMMDGILDDVRFYNVALTAAQVDLLYNSNWTAISQGGSDTCGINGGALYCWGRNNEGQDGINSTLQQTSPQQVTTPSTTWSIVSQGSDDTCAITTGGALYCWGYNHYGEVGQGGTNTTQYSTPQTVGTSISTTAWTAATIQYDGTKDGEACAIASGKLYCWGYNHRGEGGVGNTTQTYAPTQVGVATNWTSVSFGMNDTCGIAGSQLDCWGYNHLYEDGIGNITEETSPQAVGGVGDLGSGIGAEDLLGQYSSPSSTSTVVWTDNPPNNGPTALGLSYPADITMDPVNHWLFVEDMQNNRILVYALGIDNSLSTASGGHTASYVIGQPNFNSSAFDYNGVSASSFDIADNNNQISAGLAYDPVNSRLFVADAKNMRVLVFNTATPTTGMSASYVLGQSNFTNNGGGVSSTQFNIPCGVAYDAVNSRLFVADGGSSRVMVFDAVDPAHISNGMAASYVLGQSSFSGSSQNQGNASPSSQSLSFWSNIAGWLAYDPTNTRLFVSDTYNNRIMVFNVPTGTNLTDEAASYELGQASGTAFTSNTQATSQLGLNAPQGISYDTWNSRLFVADSNNQRVTVFNVGPLVIQNGENASFELGVAAGSNDFTSGGSGTTTQSSFNSQNVFYDPGTGRLFVSDVTNNRVLIFGAQFMPSWPEQYF